MAYGASELDQSNTTTNIGWGLKNSADNWAIGQRFTPGKTGALDKIIINLEKQASPVGNITMVLYADDGASPSAPTGSALTTSTTTLAAATVTTDDGGTEYTFEFADNYRMTAGTKYWFVVEAGYDQSGTNYLQTRAENILNPYAAGNMNRRNSSATWLSDQGNNDMYFKEYILPFTPDVNNNIATYLEV